MMINRTMGDNENSIDTQIHFLILLYHKTMRRLPCNLWTLCHCVTKTVYMANMK